MRYLLALLLMALPLCASATAQALNREQAQAVLAEADDAFLKGLEERGRASGGASDLFLESARRYELVASTYPNADLYLNAGNAYLFGGDAGRAVLAFRRADRLTPDDPDVQAGLRDARARVQTQVGVSPRRTAMDTLLSWRGVIPRPIMFGGFVLLYVSAWGIALARAIWGTRVPGSIGVSLALASGLLIGMLHLEQRHVSRDQSGVIIVDGVLGRNGPSREVYEPTFTTTIKPGVEVTIIEARDGWLHVRLLDGRQTWIAEETVERVAPAPVP